MLLYLNNTLLSIKLHVPHKCYVNCQKLLNIFSPTSFFLNLNYKKNHQQMELSGLFIERITKIIFWNLLTANTVNIFCTKNFGVLLKKWKIDDFASHFLIWSIKIPTGVCIYYERSIFWLSKNTTAFTRDS